MRVPGIHTKQKPRLGSRLALVQPYRAGLVADYLFRENNGTQINNGTGNLALTATAGVGWTQGSEGSGVVLNGSTQSLTAAYYAALGQTQYTVEARIKLSTLAANQMVFNTIAPAGESIYLWWNFNTGFVAANSWVSGFADGGGVFYDNVWTPGGTMDTAEHTITTTYDGANVRIFFDGVLVLTSPQTAVPRTGTGSGTLYVGQRSTILIGTFWWLNGTVNRIRMWDHAKGADEVARLTADPFAFYESSRLAGLAAPLWAGIPPPPPPPPPPTLPGVRLSGGTSRSRLYYRSIPLAESLNPETCWQSLTQRLLDYLGAPFRKATSGLLWSLLGTFARELTTCISTVRVLAGEARGGGTFTLPATFEPISVVAGVRRTDSNGTLLETYSVVSWEGRNITVSGVTAPQAGDYLEVDYSYLHNGLLGRVNTALMELNILTSSGTFLDSWGSWFDVNRVRTGKYGEAPYGVGQLYGTGGVETDSTYSNRIIDRVTQGRNTPTAIVAAVQRLTGGSPYIVTWIDSTGDNAFIFRPSGELAWAGEADTRRHLIWGRTARFVSRSAANGGAFVFEVWVPSGSGFSTSTLLTIVNQLKPAGSKAYIRYIP